MGFNKYHVETEKELIEQIAKNGFKFLKKYEKADALVGDSATIWFIERYHKQYPNYRPNMAEMEILGDTTDFIRTYAAYRQTGESVNDSFLLAYKDVQKQYRTDEQA